MVMDETTSMVGSKLLFKEGVREPDESGIHPNHESMESEMVSS
jgi:hypothetical protein